MVEVTLEGTGDLKSFEGYTPGHVIVLRHHPRSYPAAYVTASKDVTFRDVKIYHCAGMGVIAQFTENITLERVANHRKAWQRPLVLPGCRRDAFRLLPGTYSYQRLSL